MAEYTADIGKKKGEKVDYALIKDSKPIIFIEVKHHEETLSNHGTQLHRYFGTTLETKIGVLTNGIEYQFFSDIENQNTMDSEPFFTFNLESPKVKSEVVSIKKFIQHTFNIDEVIDFAEKNKIKTSIQNLLKKELENPSDDFVKYFIDKLTDKKKTPNLIQTYKEICKVAFNSMITDLAKEKITNTLSNLQNKTEIETNEKSDEEQIITTEEEMQAFFIIQAIGAEIPEISVNDITYKDTLSYFNILYKNKVTQWICRLKITDRIKRVEFKHNGKKIDLEELSDLYKYKTEIFEAIKQYL
ncbi:MAG: type I restriction enzyme HsdR N-terminal domain-containing protein [Alphaproteobacteria bacterium]|nr:type I restriction enzyme HsdR N-terminal domain-containing protein [Alphaproteobacteria bacterium]